MVVVEEVDDLEFEQCEQDPFKWLQTLKKAILIKKIISVQKRLKAGRNPEISFEKFCSK